MRLLAVDTALGACSAALVVDDAVLARRWDEMARGHAEALAPMVESLMREAGIAFAALDRVAVTTGPGTFTGQRVGLAFARALGVALNVPVVGVTTLDAMAQEALATDDAPWAIAMADAKRGEIYLGARTRNQTLLQPELIASEEVATRLAALAGKWGKTARVAGTAVEIMTPLLEAQGFVLADSKVRQPDAALVGLLAQSLLAGPPPRPLYLREPDAKLPKVALS